MFCTCRSSLTEPTAKITHMCQQKLYQISFKPDDRKSKMVLKCKAVPPSVPAPRNQRRGGVGLGYPHLNTRCETKRNSQTRERPHGAGGAQEKEARSRGEQKGQQCQKGRNFWNPRESLDRLDRQTEKIADCSTNINHLTQ